MPGPGSRKATSKQQFKFLRAVMSGKAKKKPEGLLKQEAADMVENVNYKKLPKKKKKS